MRLDLARRPFVNPRPVARLAILLWIAGLIVAAINVSVYLRHYAGSGEQRQRLSELLSEIEEEEARLEQVEAEVREFDLEWQNAQARFLNRKIAERTFSWSILFDRLSEVLPADARLITLSPRFGEEGRGRRGSEYEPRAEEVLLDIRGAARSSEVLLGFLDALFDHPSFRGADLSSESLQDEGIVRFDLSVIYRMPQREPAAAEAAVSEGDAAAGGADTEVTDG